MFEGTRPQLGKDTFVAPNASVVGDVKLGDQASVWYGAVLRGKRTERHTWQECLLYLCSCFSCLIAPIPALQAM